MLHRRLWRRTRGFFRQLNDEKVNWVTLAIVVIFGILLIVLPNRLDAERVGTWWDVAEPLTSFATFLVLIVIWIATVLKQEEDNREVSIILREVASKETITLPFRPLRGQLSRSELLGILGAYYGKPRFPPQPLHKVLNPANGRPAVLTEVIRGASDEIVIDVTQDFFDTVKASLSDLQDSIRIEDESIV